MNMKTIVSAAALAFHAGGTAMPSETDGPAPHCLNRR